MSQDELVELAQGIIKRHFPENERHQDVYLPEGLSYTYFSALWHLRDGLVTPRIILDLRNGAKMLSVGSGDGHLERVLIKGFGIPKDRINVSDKSIHPRLLTEGLTCYEFDMTKPWPDMKKSFNYVIFPESLGVALLSVPGGASSRFLGNTKRIENTVLNGGIVSDRDRDFYLELIETDVPSATHIYKVLQEAYKKLCNVGEIRLSKSGSIRSKQLEVYVELKFRRESPECECSLASGPLVISKNKTPRCR